MAYWHDIYGKQNAHKNTLILKEVFNASHDILEWIKKEEEHIIEVAEQRRERKKIWIKYIQSVFHFILSTSIIFTLLIVISNWSAYSTFAKAIIQPETLAAEKQEIEGSIHSIDIGNEIALDTLKQTRKQRLQRRNFEKNQMLTPELGANYFNQDVSQLSLSVNIAPYEDRIIIPKIGKNIPLVNVEHHDADTSTEWHKIFMKELENGIVKYPGSANPGEKGNSFIFGHSSNYPWAKGEYNDVFALLNELIAGDEIIVYFHQKKFVYTVKEKIIVKPGNVSSLGGSDSNRLLTLMTCWPLGTAINRLLVITELKETTSA